MKQETEKIYYTILSPANALLFPSTYSLELNLPGFKLLLLKIYTSLELFSSKALMVQKAISQLYGGKVYWE